jgi:hypothetical protein
MKKITLFLIAVVFTYFVGNAQYVFSTIDGPINVAQASPVTYSLNDVGNSAGVTTPTSGSYISFRVSVDWSEGSGVPWSSEADLTFTTSSGSVNINPPTSGDANSTSDATIIFEGDLPGLYDPSTDGYIDLVFNQSYSGSNADWSNIVVTLYETPSCPNPTNPTASNIMANSADLQWTEIGSSLSWNIEWGVAGFPLGSGNSVPNLNTTSYNLTGLSQGTSYDFYVQANCGDGEVSNFVGPVSFTTLIPSRINFTQQSITLNTSGSYSTAIVDMDGDFLDDIVGVQANNINIKKQNANGTFTDVNISTPTADYTPSWSIAAADYDANGKTDLLYGSGSGVTFMRASNDGTSFTEQSTSDYVFSQRSNFVDINNDGNLDAFVCHDVEPNVYFINDGTGNFTFYQSDVTAGAPYSLGNYPTGGDYGSIWIDYNNDRNIDLFIAKCGGAEERRTNMMVTNNGDGTYTENAAVIGLADPMQTWSSAWGDFDNDGDMDVFVGASSGSHKLMENSGFSDDGNPNNDYVFTDVTAGAGINAPTGWESSAYDIDNDGYLDIISNGSIMYGKGDMTFEDADNTQINYKNGSFGDLNNDGFIDTYYNETIYYNLGNSNNWVKINTVGMAHVTPNYSNRNGIGARVELVTPSGTQIRDVRSGEGFEFMSSLNTHFGIGTETSITEIRVYWPSGVVDVFENPSINTTHVLVEGTAPLSIEDQTISDISIYPNPVGDVLKIKTSTVLTEKIATIFDVTGKRAFNQMMTNNELNVSSLQGGIYFLRIESNGRSIRRKFIKK